MLGAIFATTLAFVAMEATSALLGLHRYDLGPRGLGLVFTGVGVVMAVVQGGLVVVPFSPQWIGYVALGVVAIGQGLLSTTSASLISLTGGSEHGRSFGVGQSASAGARAIGPLLAGAAFDADMALPYLGGAVLCLLAALLLLAVRSGPAEQAAAVHIGWTAETGAT